MIFFKIQDHLESYRSTHWHIIEITLSKTWCPGSSRTCPWTRMWSFYNFQILLMEGKHVLLWKAVWQFFRKLNKHIPILWFRITMFHKNVITIVNYSIKKMPIIRILKKISGSNIIKWYSITNLNMCILWKRTQQADEFKNNN